MSTVFRRKKYMPITDVSMIGNYFSLTHSYFVNRIKEFEGNGSGWQYHACVEMFMRAQPRFEKINTTIKKDPHI